MMYFRDQTFCSNPDCTCGPYRKWTQELEDEAHHWWKGPDAPVVFADFCGPSVRPKVTLGKGPSLTSVEKNLRNL